MDNTSSTKILGKISFAIIVIALVDLGFLNYWIVKNDKKLSNLQPTALATPSASGQKSGSDVVDRDVEAESPLLSPSPVEISSASKSIPASVKNETVVQNAQKEIFIPLGSSSTKSNSYTDLSGLEVKIDPGKYTSIDSIVFEAAISVDGGNGRAWAQLYVVDDKNPLIESQISNPTSTPTIKTSGNIPIPGGAKSYRVQAKTELTDYAAHVDNARLKITLK